MSALGSTAWTSGRSASLTATDGAFQSIAAVEVPLYESVHVPPNALNATSWSLFPSLGVTSIWPSVLGSIVIVAGVAPLASVEDTTLPMDGVSFRSPGSMTGSRSSRPVRSVPIPPLTNSGPWMLFSCASYGAKTFVSVPSTRSFSTDRTKIVCGAFQLAEVKKTSTWSAYEPAPADMQAPPRQTPTWRENETIPPVCEVRVGCAWTVILIVC